MTQRIRLRFQKYGSLRLISHHDLMRLFERAVRRAQISIRMSEGFNPRPKISFPIALAVGIRGLDEVVEMELDGWLHPSKILEQLCSQMPHGIEITEAELASPGGRAQVEDVTCRIGLDNSPLNPLLSTNGGKGTIEAKINELLQSKEVLACRMRDGAKRYFNIRPSIIDIVLGVNFLELRLRATTEGMARPEEVVSALGLDSETDCRLLEMTRTKVRLKG